MSLTHSIPQDILDGYNLLGIDSSLYLQTEQGAAKAAVFKKCSKYKETEVGFSQNSITFNEVKCAELDRRTQRS